MCGAIDSGDPMIGGDRAATRRFTVANFNIAYKVLSGQSR